MAQCSKLLGPPAPNEDCTRTDYCRYPVKSLSGNWRKGLHLFLRRVHRRWSALVGG